MKLLMAAYRLLQARPATGRLDVHLVTDEPTLTADQEWRRMLAPWADWVHHHPTAPIATLASAEALAAAGVRTGHAVVVLSSDAAAIERARAPVEQLGAVYVVPAPFPPGSTDANCVREVFYFDFEFGGLNESNGAKTLHAATCLQQLSATHCVNFYPRWVFRGMVEARRAAARLPMQALDIGCGPVSLLRWGALHGELSITGLDPLLPMYALVLARHGYDALPKIRCDREIAGFAEDLDRFVPENHFDVVYTRNALDHTQRPGLVVEQMGRCLAPDGIAIVEVATREGTRQNWDQFHQTDVFVENGTLMYCHRETPAVPLLSPASRLRLRRIKLESPEWLACTLERY